MNKRGEKGKILSFSVVWGLGIFVWFWVCFHLFVLTIHKDQEVLCSHSLILIMSCVSVTMFLSEDSGHHYFPNRNFFIVAEHLQLRDLA